MKSFEDYMREESEIRQEGSLFFVYIHGEPVGTYDDKLEAEDYIEDELEKEMKEDFSFVCDFCKLYCKQAEINLRLEDNSFNAPYGDFEEKISQLNRIPVCPICGRDLEETK